MCDDSITTISLTQGKFAIVDADDAAHIMAAGKWHVLRGDYVVRSVKIPGTRKSRTIYLHNWLTGCPEDTDHIDGNRLDNRRCNLRCATRRQNSANQRLRTNSTSGFKGVSWHNGDGRWRAYIRVNYKQIHLGHFATAEEAARAYDAAARTHFGEYAKMNFP